MIVAKELFLSAENRASICGRVKLTNGDKVTKKQLSIWYDAFMIKHRIEPSKIDDVVIWQGYMTEEYIKGHIAYHGIASAEVPYLPYDTTGPREMNNKIDRSEAGGKYPKFKLESVIEDRRDENGDIVIRNAWKPIRMFQPANNWRHPGSKGISRGPVSKLLQRQQQNGGMRLIDKETAGETLNNWEPLARPHTKRDMSEFLINEDRRSRIAANGPSSPEYLW
jgi:hypothetical protein